MKLLLILLGYLIIGFIISMRCAYVKYIETYAAYMSVDDFLDIECNMHLCLGITIFWPILIIVYVANKAFHMILISGLTLIDKWRHKIIKSSDEMEE